MTDPFEQLKAQYLDTFDAKCLNIKKALDDENHSALLYRVHQLSGSSGSYGFSTISDACIELENQLKLTSTLNNKIKQSVKSLLDLLNQAKA